MKSWAIIAASSAAIAAGCAPTPDLRTDDGAAVAQACFRTNAVRNFRQGRTGQVYVRSDRGAVFEISHFGGCTDLHFANQIVLVPQGGGLGGSRACVGDDLRILAPAGGRQADYCHARVTRALTPEEVAALPASHRP